jgi:hypothetical protein
MFKYEFIIIYYYNMKYKEILTIKDNTIYKKRVLFRDFYFQDKIQNNKIYQKKQLISI